MDFHVYAVIAIVFLVSFFTLLFISKLPRGKTFDEVLAEKRQLAEKLYGPNYGHKNKVNKNKVNNNKKANKKTKVAKDVKEPAEQYNTEELESDANSDGNISENNSPSHHHSKGHVEFVEAEVIPIESLKKPFTQSAHNNKPNAPPKRKNSKSPGTGILINKLETTPVNKNDQVVVEQLNHFEEILPKDVIELKLQKDDVSTTNKDSIETNKNKNATKESKKGKNKKDTTYDSETKENDAPILNGIDTFIEKSAAQTVSSSKGHDHQPPKSKKKKQEIDAVQKLIDDREGISVNFLIPLLSKAELTRNEIQILIDFLLNKQQDTTIDHSEWSEGRSDVVQKLKKQLAEKEKALQDEQDASSAIQAKLKELRVEINAERSQFNAQIKMQADEIHAKKLEIQNLTSDIQYMNDKFNAEKQTITVQMQQIQSKLMQEKKNNSQEIIQIEQLNDQNNALQNELIAKNAVMLELNDKYQHLKLVNEENLKKIPEYEKKYNEYEIVLRQKDEQKNYIEQELENQRKHIQDFQYREQEYSRINVENERLRSDLRRKDEFQNLLEMQQYENEKLKQQIVDFTKVQHMDDNNKVEIRNLQNALDSALKEANKLRIDAADSKKIIDDLNLQIRDLTAAINNLTVKSCEQVKQISELGQVDSKYRETLAEKEAKIAQYEMQLKSTTDKEDELFKQVQEFKEKNNEIRTRNWKLNEALQKAESNAVKLLNSNINSTKNNKVDSPAVDIKGIEVAEQNRIKQQLQNILPELKLNDDNWIENLGTYIRNKLSENDTTCNSNSNSINNSNNKYNNTNNNKSTNDENDVDGDDDDSIRNEQINVILLENKGLKDKLDSYKKLLTETDSLLKNIQKMSEEKEIYYQGIVENKNVEINQLKSQAT